MKLNTVNHKLMYLAIAVFFSINVMPNLLWADLDHGSAQKAETYYKLLPNKIGFSTPEKIFSTTLDDVVNYLGYVEVTGKTLQDGLPETLMSPSGPLAAGKDEILATRFFAPKIMNIKLSENARPIGWRKLVRLRARLGSLAEANNIDYGIILFNFFTAPGEVPFGPGAESGNTQVMLITNVSKIPPSNVKEGPDTIYWLDYGPLSAGGTLSFFLPASFDANELQPDEKGIRKYFVPQACNACHGNNERRPMVNYLDTDHWFDRLENDFKDLKTTGLPPLFDAQSNDTNAESFKKAFDVIRRFNQEADEQVQHAQPEHDETLASKKWLELHASSEEHFQPIDRTIGNLPHWSKENEADVKSLNYLNQYCFRCHGTVQFSVFNKQSMFNELRLMKIKQRISPDAKPGVRMPPDRELPNDVREYLLTQTFNEENHQ